MSKTCHDDKGSSLIKKVRHDVKKLVMTSIVCYKVKNMSCHQNVRNDVQKRHDVIKFVMTSIIYQKFIMMSKIRHEIKNMS